MKDFLKYFIPFSLAVMAFLFGMFLFSAVTGKACLSCDVGTAQTINPGDLSMMIMTGVLVLMVPPASLALLGLGIVFLRITASVKVKRDAERAEEMGEHGVGTMLFGKK